MHDRVPGAPGQYKLTISSEDVQKFLANEPCTVVLTRDDQPEMEGTPYNKASVLPDDLAAAICPGIDDPTPADALRGLRAQYYAITLTADGWEGETAPFTQTVAVAGILESDRPHYGPVYSADAETALLEKEGWAVVDDLETSDGSVTLTCFEEKPEVDITVQLEVNR